MINIAVVDDDELILQQVRAYVGRYFDGRQDAFTLHVFHDGMELIERYRPIYQIIFMDIEMRRLDGMATARRVRQIDGDVVFVFVTNLAKFAVKGYEVNALDFLIKPLKYAQFCVSMKKAEAALARRRRSSVVLNMNGDIRVLRSEDICYIEASDHWLIYYTRDASYRVRGALAGLAEQLPPGMFQLCHRCYLVNLRFVTALSGSELRVGPYTLNVSRSKRAEFVRALTDYFGGSY